MLEEMPQPFWEQAIFSDSKEYNLCLVLAIWCKKHSI